VGLEPIGPLEGVTDGPVVQVGGTAGAQPRVPDLGVGVAGQFPVLALECGGVQVPVLPERLRDAVGVDTVGEGLREPVPGTRAEVV
jgi:hypothetical protein